MPRRALRSYPTNYATDLTDEQWAAIAPLVATPSPNGDRPTDIDRRAIVITLLYKNRTGCQWRLLPAESLIKNSGLWYGDHTLTKRIFAADGTNHCESCIYSSARSATELWR